MTLKDIIYSMLNNFKNNASRGGLIFTGKIRVYLGYFIFLIIIFFSYIFISNSLHKKNSIHQKNFQSLLKSEEFTKTTNFLFENLRSPYSEFKYIIQDNDNIEKILNKFNVDKNEIKIAVNELYKSKLTNIYSGRELNIILKKKSENFNSIVKILYPISNTLSIEIRKNQNTFLIKKNILQLNKKETLVSSTIVNNLYSSAIKSGIEPNIIIEFARIYGFEIDFQRDIRKDDVFKIYYEKFVDGNDVVKDTGKIIYASMNVNNREINLYKFKYKDEEGYYDINGKSIVKSLMKTPINGARLSSPFGMRKHPILGYNKKHLGTDFAAPSGTPIMASGSGTIIRSRWCGGGGNCIKIKHNSTYQTIYAHLKSFAKGIKEGRKVKQGQIIGYVGSTGMSTGPHLHYEVIVNGKKVNSQKLKLPSGKILKGDERKEFEIERIKIDLKISELRTN
tara:strand:- start:2198 stop:3547 length:1350 start_codon:yes stop_codon:yes gene_type:complete